MAPSPITPWQTDGETWKQWQTFFSWAPKPLQTVTAAMKLKDVCSLEKKLWQTRQHIKKQRHHFSDQSLCSQSYGFSSSHVQMWELNHKEGWTQKIDAFELWCWRRLLRIPWTTRRSNQSILKEISAEDSLKGLMLKLKLQYFGHQRPWCWKKLREGEEGDNRGWDGWMISPTQCTWVWVNSGSWWWTRRPDVLQSMGLQRVRQD